MRSPEEQIELIRGGRMTQFQPYIFIPASALLPGYDTEVQFGGLATALSIPPTWVDTNYNVQTNPLALVLGVRFNLRSAPVIPFGLQGNNVSAFSGPVDRIFVSLLSGTAAPVVLLAGMGFGLGYSGALTAAGTPSASPSTIGAKFQ